MSTTNHWKLGLFVLASFAVFVGVAFWMGAKRFDRETFFAYTYFDEAVDGLDIGSSVKFRGVQIGSVSRIRAAPDKVRLEVEAKIDIKTVVDLGLNNPKDRDVGISPGLRAQLVRSWVTGVAFVQTDFFDEETHPIPNYSFELPDDVVHAVPSSQKSLELGLQESLHRVPTLLDSITATSDSLGKAVEQIDFAVLSQRMSDMIGHLDGVLAQIESEGLVAESRGALQDLRGALNSVETLTDGLAEDGSALHRAIDELHATLVMVKRILADAEPGPTLAGLRRASNEFSLLMRSLRRLSNMLERDPGALVHGREAATLPIPEGR